jgi:hypothetical protein
LHAPEKNGFLRGFYGRLARLHDKHTLQHWAGNGEYQRGPWGTRHNCKIIHFNFDVWEAYRYAENITIPPLDHLLVIYLFKSQPTGVALPHRGSILGFSAFSVPWNLRGARFAGVSCAMPYLCPDARHGQSHSILPGVP